MDDPALPGPGRREWLALLLLVLVALGLRMAQIAATEVTTRDSIAFIRFAWQLEHRPTASTLRQNKHHPLYPVAVLAASKVIRPFYSGNLPRAMELSTQAVNLVVAACLAVAMYFLGRELFGPAVGFWGALLFQVLPASGRLLGDGLSEPLFWLWAALALFAGTRGLRQKHVGWLVAMGAFSGLAYLTRPEGLLLPAVCGVVLLVWGWQQDRRRALFQSACVLAALLVIAAPYMITIGGLTGKPSASNAIDPSRSDGVWGPKERAGVVASPLPLAMWNTDPSGRRWLWAGYAVVSCLNQAFFHGLTLLVLIGLLAHRRLRPGDPAFALLALLGVLMLALGYRLAQSNGYLSERHLMLFVVPGMFWLALGLDTLARCLPSRWPVPAFLLLLLAVGGVMTVRPLHPDRSGFRQAGEWIARNTLPGDRLFDPYAHAYYHSGRLFVEGQEGLPKSDPVTSYVVLEESKNRHPHLHHLVGPARAAAEAGGVVVARIPVRRKRDMAYVVVYRVPQALPGTADF